MQPLDAFSGYAADAINETPDLDLPDPKRAFQKWMCRLARRRNQNLMHNGNAALYLDRKQ